MTRIIYKILLKLKNNVLLIPIVNYIKYHHPYIWKRIKNHLLFKGEKISKISGYAKREPLNAYTKDFVERATLEIEACESMRKRNKT